MASAGAIILGLLLLIGGFLFTSMITAAEQQAMASNPIGYGMTGWMTGGRYTQSFDIYKTMGMGAMGLGGLLLILGFIVGGKKEEVIIQQAPAPSQPQQQQNIGKYCIKCGTELEVEHKFCPKCGRAA